MSHILYLQLHYWNLQHVGLSFCNTLSWLDKTELAKCQNMMTSSNRKILRVTGLLCGEFTGHRGILHTKATDAELWCFFDLCMNGRLIEQSWGWWFETPSCSLWRHFNVILNHVFLSIYLLNGYQSNAWCWRWHIHIMHKHPWCELTSYHKSPNCIRENFVRPQT